MVHRRQVIGKLKNFEIQTADANKHLLAKLKDAIRRDLFTQFSLLKIQRRGDREAAPFKCRYKTGICTNPYLSHKLFQLPKPIMQLVNIFA